jgi:nitroimidazol reductase NimA-like FMN-containing flavoprotein (pyridoxamine 5'-phosphate oxidase superfamily)
MATVPERVATRISDRALMAHLATSVDDRPHVAPVWYHYADDAVEVVTNGKKLSNVRTNPRVALSIEENDEGRGQWMVTLFGTATLIDEAEAIEAAAERIAATYPDGETFDIPEDRAPAADPPTLVRIDVASVAHSGVD